MKLRIPWRRPEQEGPQETPRARRLWGKEFSVVSQGLAEEELIAFVNDLIARNRALQQQQGTAPSIRALSRQVLAEAEQEAAALKARAKREADMEAARAISQAKERAQDMVTGAKRHTEELTEKDVQNILLTARKRAELTETQARQVAQRFLMQAREDILGQITLEVKEAYYGLIGTLQELLTKSQSIETDWKSKTMELWSVASPELEEYQARPLGSLSEEELTESLHDEGLLEDTILVEKSAEESPGQTDETPLEAEAVTQSGEAETLAAPDLDDLSQEAVQETMRVPDAEEVQDAEPLTEEAPWQAMAPETGEETQDEGVAGAEPLTEEAPWQAMAPETGEETQDEEVAGAEPLTEEASWRDILPERGEEAGVEAETDAELPEEPRAPFEAPSEGNREAVRSYLYSGEVDLVLAPPVDVNRVSTRYAQLQNIPGLQVLRTAGSWEEGTIVTIVLDEPSPVISLLEAIPMVEAMPKPVEGKGTFMAGLGSLGDKGRQRERIAITFRDQEETEDNEG